MFNTWCVTYKVYDHVWDRELTKTIYVSARTVEEAEQQAKLKAGNFITIIDAIQ